MEGQSKDDRAKRTRKKCPRLNSSWSFAEDAARRRGTAVSPLRRQKVWTEKSPLLVGRETDLGRDRSQLADLGEEDTHTLDGILLFWKSDGRLKKKGGQKQNTEEGRKTPPNFKNPF